MADLYMNLNYDQWKSLEEQMKTFRETAHGKGTEYYHKSIRIKVTDDLNIEFHGPLVKARQADAVVS